MTDTPVRALLLEQIHPDAEEILRRSGCAVETVGKALDEDELIDRIDGFDLVGIRSKTKITERVLENAPHLSAIGAFCIGTSQIDTGAAAERGVAVFNAPFSNTRSVVDLAVAEIIMLTRGVTEKNRLMHEGVWDKSAEGAHEVRGRTLGIVGYGNIGMQLSTLAENLGMRVLFYDTADRLALGNARRCLSLEELLENSDVVTLHVDDRPSNTNFFGEPEFATMRQGSLFLNLSRGFVVDYGALRTHIQDGHIRGAAVDVFPVEPKGRGEEFVSDLRGLPNVILTPHIGGSTEEAQQDIGRFVATKLRDYLLGGATAMSVNLPPLALPRVPETYRITVLHRNVPGVMATINNVFATHKVNVEAQLLGTRDQNGYAITDVTTDHPQTLAADLDSVESVTQIRVLSPAG